MAKPWLTSDDLIAAVKRKIALPISQITFTESDILDFANEEMAISQVPSVMSFHEEYFVTEITADLQANKSRYPIPDRAIGLKLRDLFWKDANNNYFEMTRISSEDKAYFQRNIGANQAIHKFYLEGNDIVLAPQVTNGPTGKLSFFIFLRPNQLVKNERAGIVQYFTKDITIDNSLLVPGDTLTIGDTIFTAVSGSPSANEFQIGVSSIVTATNLKTAIVTADIIAGADNGSPSTAIITLQYIPLNTVITGSSSGISVQSTQGIKIDTLPTNFIAGDLFDFLQTKPGHRTRAMSKELLSISGTILEFNSSDVPTDLIISDYICSENECIIPQIPSDLHTVLTERTCARILAALGDQQGLATVNQKLAEMETRQGTLIDSRVDGAPQKIMARHSLLRYGKMGTRRRL